jgi:rsbT co-antagonist protein RsbR
MDSHIPAVVRKHREELLRDWVKEQQQRIGRGDDVSQDGAEFLRLLVDAAADGDVSDIDGEKWAPIKELLASVSRTRSQQGYSPSETATFVFSFKKPLFARLRDELASDPAALAREYWTATQLIDSLGLYTTEVYQRSREDVINRQQQEMLELSTPVVKLWEGVLALPMIGTLDSARTQVVMESLLQKIVETGSKVAILDITGVPTVDTLVAQHLLKTVAAARLMGAECIISGIRPQIAQTIVHLGVELGGVVTKATLADAFALALQRHGLSVSRAPKAKET